LGKQVYLNHLELRKIGQTFFHWNRQKYSVRDAPPQIFDQWIRQFVESIVNVDIEKWDSFQRWNIINAVLNNGLLVIAQLQSGDKLGRPPMVSSEEKASEVEVQLEETASEKGGNHGVVSLHLS
jgi:hypothetical protein